MHIGREKLIRNGVRHNYVVVLIFIFSGLFYTESARAFPVDAANLILGPSDQYFSSDGSGGGEFALSLSPITTLFQMQSGGLPALSGLLTSYQLTGSKLTSDSSSGVFASATFDNESIGGIPATLTIMASLIFPVIVNTPITLLEADVVGPGTASELSGTDDMIQIQFPMQVTGGELQTGTLTGHTLSGFVATYTFDGSFGTVDPDVDDFMNHIFFAQGVSGVQFTPEPAATVLLSLGGLALIRRRKT